MKRAAAVGLAIAAVAALSMSPGGGAATEPAPAAVPLPLSIGGPFRLIDQTGAERTEADPDGRMQLLFFGFAKCRSICTVALPQMAAITEGLRQRGVALRPVMITVDPDRDTPDAMAQALRPLDRDFVGLTGNEAALQAAYHHFSVERTLVFDDPFDGPVFAHGSLLYLLDGKGKLLTIIPPILSDARAMDIIAGYAPAG